MVKCLCVCKSHLFPLAGCVRQRTEINQTNLGVAEDVSNVSKTASIVQKKAKQDPGKGKQEMCPSLKKIKNSLSC